MGCFCCLWVVGLFVLCVKAPSTSSQGYCYSIYYLKDRALYDLCKLYNKEDMSLKKETHSSIDHLVLQRSGDFVFLP